MVAAEPLPIPLAATLYESTSHCFVSLGCDWWH